MKAQRWVRRTNEEIRTLYEDASFNRGNESTNTKMARKCRKATTEKNSQNDTSTKDRRKEEKRTAEENKEERSAYINYKEKTVKNEQIMK